MTLQDALWLATNGWPVFPAELVDGKKVPIGSLVEHGYKEATVHAKRIALWWRIRPDALVGVALPRQTVALDVDDVKKFEDAGLDLPAGPGQHTPRGGYHRFFKSDGRKIRQTVKEVPGADTRVGGLGYVIAWEPREFPNPEELPDAPEWLYSAGAEADDDDKPRRDSADVVVIKMGERDNKLAQMAGSLRRIGWGPEAIYGALRSFVASGQVEQTREDPITEHDLKRIARSIGARSSAAVDAAVISRRPPTRHFATDILKKDYGELVYFIEDLMPVGLGIIAGPPKVGKSWLILQATLEAATGGELLDRRAAEPVPVLYYALEDGPRRAQHRMGVIIGKRDLEPDILEFRFEAPRIGDGLEEEIDEWLTNNDGGLVVIDVLAKVRPQSRGRGSAYDEDYSVLTGLHEITKRHNERGSPTAVVFVTHLRKAGAEDPFAMVQGTTAVTGAADWTWLVRRDRMASEGTIQVQGRDIENEPLVNAVFDGVWTAVGQVVRGGSQRRDMILEALLTEGDMTTGEVVAYLNEHVLGPTTQTTRNLVNEKLVAMEKAHLVEKSDEYVAGPGGGYEWHAITDEDRATFVATAKTAARQATEASGGNRRRGFVVRRVSSRTRGDAGDPAGADASPPAQAPHSPQAREEPVEGVEGVVGGSAARPPAARTPRRPRAPAHTRAHSGEIDDRHSSSNVDDDI